VSAKDDWRVFVHGGAFEQPSEVASGRGDDLLALLHADAARGELSSAGPPVGQRPIVTIMFALPTYSPCAPSFVPVPACAHEVFAFYPTVGGAPPLLAQIGASEAVYLEPGLASAQARRVMIAEPEARLASTLTLWFLDDLGIPTRIEAASISTEAQAGWVSAAALLGLALASSFALLVRSRTRLDLAGGGTNGP
jgi:hypothetical protein